MILTRLLIYISDHDTDHENFFAIQLTHNKTVSKSCQKSYSANLAWTPSQIHTVREFALFEHLTEPFTQFEVTLCLRTFEELFQLIGAGILLHWLLLIHGLLLVHGLRLIWLLEDSFIQCYLLPRHKHAHCGKKTEYSFGGKKKIIHSI